MGNRLFSAAIFIGLGLAVSCGSGASHLTGRQRQDATEVVANMTAAGLLKLTELKEERCHVDPGLWQKAAGAKAHEAIGRAFAIYIADQTGKAPHAKILDFESGGRIGDCFEHGCDWANKWGHNASDYSKATFP